MVLVVIEEVEPVVRGADHRRLGVAALEKVPVRHAVLTDEASSEEVVRRSRVHGLALGQPVGIIIGELVAALLGLFLVLPSYAADIAVVTGGAGAVVNIRDAGGVRRNFILLITMQTHIIVLYLWNQDVPVILHV